ncbi:helix-turn-helix domain-containing protein [Halomonas mongoliensis]|uniref:helix-turn-helix domain-containing protein n=1 Tax=Halomonas mongoliensis TaxID=321265 RepID=UPI00403AF120
MVKQIQALARGLEVVEAIQQAPQPPTLGELHEVTGLDRATILRILATLEEAHWVYRGMGDKRYRLAYALQEIGYGVSVHDVIAQASGPVLDNLQKDLRWPSDIAVYDGESVAIIETSRRHSPITVNREVVGYRPSMLKSAMGRCFLAFSDDRRRNTILEQLKQLPGEEGKLAANRDYVKALVAEVQGCGYGRREPGSWVLPTYRAEEFRAIAVPVMVMGDIQAAINVVWFQEAYDNQEMEQYYYSRLKLAADELGQIFATQELY